MMIVTFVVVAGNFSLFGKLSHCETYPSKIDFLKIEKGEKNHQKSNRISIIHTVCVIMMNCAKEKLKRMISAKTNGKN